MRDFEAFQTALADSSHRDVDGEPTYMNSLMNSMSLVLEEFYEHLNVVGVSSLYGTGIDEFFEAVQQKADEFRRDYQPELERRREEREENKKKARERELDKMMKGMSMGGGSSANVEVGDVKDASSGDSSDDDLDEDDREGLQARYAAAVESQGDSLNADASFAKYLHSQK